MKTLAKRSVKLLVLVLLVALSHSVSAHPMGNFSVNHYSRITLQNDRISIRYFIDLAEIPTFQELQNAGISTTSIDPNAAAIVTYVAQRGAELGRGLVLDVNGSLVPLRLASSGVIFPPGAGGLPTMKMGFVYEAAYPTGSPTSEQRQINVQFTDQNYSGHAGWKEIVAGASSGSLLRSTVPTTDRSGELSNYPTDLLTSPPQELQASLAVALDPLPASLPATHSTGLSHSAVAPLQEQVPAPIRTKGHAESLVHATPASLVALSDAALQTAPASTINLQANRQQTPRSRFTELIQTEHISLWFLFTAALIAISLGGLHALEPGHGKTIVAAYLVGSKGTARHAVLLGLIVTLSHTAGVFTLGAITLYASRYIVPEQLYPWLGALSGVTIAGLGCYMLVRRLTGTATDHVHTPGESHGHWMFWKTRNSEDKDAKMASTKELPAQSVSLAQLFTLGITGGIIPCPAALIVLLSAFALHRVGLGFFLIVAFSVGLAAVLIGFGMLMVYARRFMGHLQIDGPLTRRWLPVASSAFITILGISLTVQALSSVHISGDIFSKETLGPALFVTLLGLVLGMRHSTDADHVVAISTIVSKQKSIRNAAFIGSVWGLGHTITIFIVGALIILFGVEIPPRLGLSMEFSVALMLILLGVLNLSGVLQKLTSCFTPADGAGNASSASVQIRRTKNGLEDWLERSVSRIGLYHFLRPLIIGLVHGLAGSAAVALLVLSTIHNPGWATVYLLIFGAGTLIGMMCMTAVIAVPLAFAGDRFAKLSRFLGAASGMVSLCFGSFLVYQLGFLGGLFTNHPQWTPR